MLNAFLQAVRPAAAGSTPVATVAYRRAAVGGLDIFYRDAGPADAPVIVLLHGFPSSSHMFRNLIPALADRYRVIAPDYPGFGYSSAPAPEDFAYSFDALADVVETLLADLGVRRYALYLQDFGGPVGMRIAARHPERVTGLIVQNAVANLEGFAASAVGTFGPYWADRNAETEKPLRGFLTAETTRFQYEHGASARADRVSPDAWQHDQWLLDRPGNDRIQLELLYRYQDNVGAYPQWQAYLRAHQPNILVTWGDNDPFFTAAGRDLFKALVPATEVHAYDAGHFALETHGPEIAAAIRAFLARVAPAA
ncbi:alpha/beta fold hydrolase [Xanthobacter versatilis]|uniref:alpha/beta fold hydrolase n=1 Tax=Xanthobacter autotrophicus (strain ATCC BAA-1158 / Py2) TaxID=78245 RepID=UPI003729E513